MPRRNTRVGRRPSCRRQWPIRRRCNRRGNGDRNVDRLRDSDSVHTVKCAIADARRPKSPTIPSPGCGAVNAGRAHAQTRYVLCDARFVVEFVPNTIESNDNHGSLDERLWPGGSNFVRLYSRVPNVAITMEFPKLLQTSDFDDGPYVFSKKFYRLKN